MSKFFYNPTVGINLSADFSMLAILSPNSDIYKKSFKINHDVDGFNHLALFHYLKNHNLEAYVISPLVTNSSKNKDIRKVKNDIKDSLSMFLYDNLITTGDYINVFPFVY